MCCLHRLVLCADLPSENEDRLVPCAMGSRWCVVVVVTAAAGRVCGAATTPHCCLALARCGKWRAKDDLEYFTYVSCSVVNWLSGVS